MALPSTEIQTARDGNLEICILSEDIRGKFQNKCKKKRGRFPDQWLRCLGTLPDSRFLHFCLKQTIQDRYWGSTGKPLLGPPVSLIVQLQFRPFSCLSSFLLIYVGKAQLMTKVLGPCHPCGRSRWWSSRLQALAWPRPSHCNLLRSESDDGRSLCVYLPLCHSAFLNKYVLYETLKFLKQGIPKVLKMLWEN